MKIIERSTYLEKLKRLKGTPDIKVITGVRRSGKSRLMESYMEWLENTDQDANIIYIDYTSLQFEDLKEYHALNKYVEEHYQRGKSNYLFVDEVQMCPQFELTINSLHSSEKYDIYVTGSNAFLLSSDLATLFTGRTYEIEVFPFSFAEYAIYYKAKNPEALFDRYVREGGMAGSFLYKTENEKYDYIRDDVFNALIVRDIISKYKIRNKPFLEKLMDFLMDNVGNISS